MLKINTKKEEKIKEENKKKSSIPRYITFLILSIILGGIFTALTSYAATIAASNISYDNTTSGLSATTAQAAIDEIATKEVLVGKYFSHSPELGDTSEILGDVTHIKYWVAYKETKNYLFLESVGVIKNDLFQSTSKINSAQTFLLSSSERDGITYSFFPFYETTLDVSQGCSCTTSQSQIKSGNSGSLDYDDMVTTGGVDANGNAVSKIYLFRLSWTVGYDLTCNSGSSAKNGGRWLKYLTTNTASTGETKVNYTYRTSTGTKSCYSQTLTDAYFKLAMRISKPFTISSGKGKFTNPYVM